MAHSYKVTAIWDAEAKVFTSATDVPGLVIEADTFEEFVALVEELGPEVLEANVPKARRPFVFEVESHRTLAVA